MLLSDFCFSISDKDKSRIDLTYKKLKKSEIVKINYAFSNKKDISDRINSKVIQDLPIDKFSHSGKEYKIECTIREK